MTDYITAQERLLFPRIRGNWDTLKSITLGLAIVVGLILITTNAGVSL